MDQVQPPEIGDFTAWVVGGPGPDIDYALCINRKDDQALLRFQVWQQPGPWHEQWVTVTGPAARYGCWKTQRLDQIGEALQAERHRMMES